MTKWFDLCSTPWGASDMPSLLLPIIEQGMNFTCCGFKLLFFEFVVGRGLHTSRIKASWKRFCSCGQTVKVSSAGKKKHFIESSSDGSPYIRFLVQDILKLAALCSSITFHHIHFCCRCSSLHGSCYWYFSLGSCFTLYMLIYAAYQFDQLAVGLLKGSQL